MTTINKTFWPDDLATRGWAPISRSLMRHWHQFDLDLSCFATLIWVLRWAPLNRSYANRIRIVQRALANEMGVGPGTPGKHLRKLEGAGLIRITKGAPRQPVFVDITPLFDRLRVAETTAAQAAIRAKADKALLQVGLQLCGCGRDGCRGCGRPATAMALGWAYGPQDPPDDFLYGEPPDRHDPPEEDPPEVEDPPMEQWMGLDVA